MPLSSVDEYQRQLLLLHLLRSKQVLLAAKDKLVPTLFSDYEIAYRLMWDIARNYFINYGNLCPLDVLWGIISSSVDGRPELVAVRDNAQTLLTWIASYPEESLVPEMVLKEILQPFLDERVLKPQLTNLQVDANLGSNIESLHTQFIESRIASATPTKLFDLEDDALNNPAPAADPSGCAVFDAMTGGIRPKHMTGILAGYGAGKTTLGIDLGVNVAKTRRHAFIFHYEQEVSSALRYRIWSNALGIATSQFTNTDFKDLPSELKEKLRECKYLDDYLHVIDMQKAGQGTNGVADIKALLLQYISQGIKPAVVIVDWLGLLVTKWAAAQNKKLDSDYAFYSSAIHELRYQIANECDCEVVIAHQLNASAGSANPTHRVSIYDAAGYKAFAETMDTCIVVGNLDTNNIQRIFNGKNRGSRDEIYAQNNGDICSLTVMDGRYTSVVMDGSAQFVRNNAAGMGATGFD